MTVAPLTSVSLVVPHHGHSDVLTIEDREVAAPGPGQIRVEVAAVGVNFIEIYQREGVYPVPTPFVLGAEGSGIVESVGDATDGSLGFAVGDRVAWAEGPGSGAAYVTLPADKAVAIPDGVDLDVAAASMLQGITAHYLVNSTYAVQPGDTVLAHAVAGGVGQLLVQLVHAKGATLIGTAGSPEKVAIGTRLGADHVIDYSALDDMGELGDRVRELTGGEGVHVVYDGVGKDTFDASLASLRRRGTLVLFGGASGQVPPFDIQRLNSGGSLYLTRPTMAHYVATREELEWRTSEILGAVASGELSISIGGRYPLAEAGAAYDALAGRRSTGKLLLIP
ncbi:MAG: quinone oxidoreductase [Actinomycetota bacterium]|nr:quinone oxidoreductase [Actinomycetota bacterium]